MVNPKPYITKETNDIGGQSRCVVLFGRSMVWGSAVRLIAQQQQEEQEQSRNRNIFSKFIDRMKKKNYNDDNN